MLAVMLKALAAIVIWALALLCMLPWLGVSLFSTPEANICFLFATYVPLLLLLALATKGGPKARAITDWIMKAVGNPLVSIVEVLVAVAIIWGLLQILMGSWLW